MDSQAMTIREENWLRTIRTAVQSGKTQKDWCRENGIAPSSYYRWKQTLRNKLLSEQRHPAADAPGFAELTLPKDCSKNPPVSAQNKLLLHTRDFTIELPANCNEEQLCKVIRAVRHAG